MAQSNEALSPDPGVPPGPQTASMHPPKGTWALAHAAPPKGTWAQVHAAPPKGAWALHMRPDFVRTVVHPPAMLLQLVLVALAVFVVPNLHTILNRLGTPDPALSAPVLQGGFLLVAVLAAVGAAALLRAGTGMTRGLGLSWNGWRGPVLALLATLPCWVGCMLTAAVSTRLGALNLLLAALLFPFAGELVFRGFGFIYARRALRWHLWIALVLQALAFTVPYILAFPLGAGPNGLETWSAAHASLLLVPFAGGLLLAILNMLDGYTLWSGWIWRASVTAALSVFAVAPNAANSGFAILLVAASGLLAILLLWPFRNARA